MTQNDPHGMERLALSCALTDANKIIIEQKEEISRLKEKVNDLRQKYRSTKGELRKTLQTEKALQAIFTRIDNLEKKLGRPHE